MAIHAVLTGDIVNSTLLGRPAEKKLVNALEQVLAGHPYEFYRGDSFQAYIVSPVKALQLALLCRTAAISTGYHAAGIAADVRISIGIGKVQGQIKALGTARGEAFVLSGRAFDTMAKTGTHLVISAANQLGNEGLAVIADYTNAIFKNMTGKQAGVIFELLKEETQQAVAAKLKKSKSTVSQHVTAARWPEIEKLVTHYQNIINQLI